MKIKEIKLSDYGHNDSCVEAKDGEKVYPLIKQAINEDFQVKLIFSDIKTLTTAFLNTAIGQIYGEFSEEEVKAHMSVGEISNAQAITLKRVIDTAKQFYNNPDALQNSINDILDE